MADPGQDGSLLGMLSRGFQKLLGTENLEIVNPEGGKEDVMDEAARGRFSNQDKEGYFKQAQKYIGADVTSLVTLPVIIFEPMTMLQKMCELMEYTELLNKADSTDDPNMRMVYTAAWAVSPYVAFSRTWKPFNPILGETFEYSDHNNVTFVNEQVSHHPPICAGHGENEHFVYDCTSKVKTKFLGNSVEVYPLGRTRVKLKRSGHVFDLVPPPTKVQNIIFGRTWVDSPGDMVLTNTTTGEKVVLFFQPCGWFGAGRYEVDGYVYDSSEEPKMLITGKWNESLSYQPCDNEGEPLEGSTLTEVWRLSDLPEDDKFQFTHFAKKLNSFETAPTTLLPSDSRLRPDRKALEEGDINQSATEKYRLEEHQRAEKREREKRKDAFVPKWFRSSGETAVTPWGDLEIYEYTGLYDERKSSISEAPVEDTSKQEFSPWQYPELRVEVQESPVPTGIVAL
ncbi:hypothetical protein CLOM_g17313 [Closterium sp. NIES-68]|nr:hypothetical protein CLOM_g17313 [Closterium sp. NIES-68]GJP62874.1 hypothetical protein CLOP_g19946 [Closterium sp. NIES-67]